MALRVLSRAIAPAKRITTHSSLLAPSTRQLHTSVNVLAIAIEFDGVTQPRAADKFVNVVFVNYKGQRTTLKAEVGKTLLHAAVDNSWPFIDPDAGNSATNSHRYNKEGNWFEPTYGEGPYSSATHVIIPKDKYHLCPPMQHAEEQRLLEYPFKEDMTETSRLAEQVTVVPEMDGMVVYVPDPEDTDIP